MTEISVVVVVVLNLISVLEMRKLKFREVMKKLIEVT